MSTADGDDGDTRPSEEAAHRELRGYEGWQVLVSAVAAVVVTAGLIWWVSGFATSFEALFRVGPTVSGGGVGADWVTGNTVPALDFLIALVHALDVILGLFILLLVFLHWTAFRRLADRMRRPGEVHEETVLADGGDSRPSGGED